MTKSTVVRIPSKSKPDGPAHIVVIDPDGAIRCDCPGYLYRGRCRHLTQVREARQGDAKVTEYAAAARAQRPPRTPWVEEV
jgi:hypothetical protein